MDTAAECVVLIDITRKSIDFEEVFSMLNESNSKSARRTKHLFKDALMRLLETESFACISVKDIVETADYNRTTFYNHYYDKFDLLDDITKELLDGFTESVRNSFKGYPLTQRKSMNTSDITIFDYVYQNRRAISLCLQNDVQKRLILKSLDTIHQTLIETWTPIVHLTEKQISTDARIFTYTLAGTIQGWMEEKFVTPPDEVRAAFVSYHNQKL